ncbi:VOC family protein [Aquipuribacter hungaricus]|uniref:VOC family protein n=1 Tax=Aquipuribacter hungaricus TaxID=545624 RepID=A0ABV7WDT0_9MICO
MTTYLAPYLSFRDGAFDAMQHYQRVFGGELTRATFADYGMAEDPAEADKTMHSQLVTPTGWRLMGADTPSSMEHTPGGFSVSLSGEAEDAEHLHHCWDGLAEGGEVQEKLDVAPWGDEFGMLTDRFGVHWMVNIAGAPATDG